MKIRILSACAVMGFLFLGTSAIAQTTRDDQNMTNQNMNTDQQKTMTPQNMMTSLDKDGDKMISRDEAGVEQGAMLKDKFDDADTSKDGMISMKELKAYQKGMKKDMKSGMKSEKMKMKKEVDSMGS